MSEAIQRPTVLSQQANRTIIGPLHEAIHFFVNDVSRLLAILARACHQGSARKRILALAEGDRAEPLTHTPAGDHLASNGRDTLQIVFRTGRDMSNGHLLSSPT